MAGIEGMDHAALQAPETWVVFSTIPLVALAHPMNAEPVAIMPDPPLQLL